MGSAGGVLGVAFATVLSLRDRPDRLARFRAQAFGDVFELVQERHPVSGALGCFEGHVRMWIEGEARGAGPQVCFEDDAEWSDAYVASSADKVEMSVFVRPDPIKMRADLAQTLARVMREHPAWELIALGGVPLAWLAGAHDTGIPGVLGARFLTAHAYVISPTFRARALRMAHRNGVDHFLARAASHVFCVSPQAVVQSVDGGSDISALSAPLRGVRDAYAAYATWAARSCGTVPLRQVQVALVAASAVGLGVLGSKHVAARAALMLVLLVAVSLYVADTFVQDVPYIRDTAAHTPFRERDLEKRREELALPDRGRPLAALAMT